MFLSELQVGKSIEIFVYRTGYKYRLVSKIEDVGENNFCITLIANREKVFRFLDTDKIEIIYRKDEFMWRWKHFKANIAIIDGLRVHQLTLHADTEGEKYNRRNTFRVYVGEEIILTYFEIDSDAEMVKELQENYEAGKELQPLDEMKYIEKHCKAFIKDLSENGIGFFSNHVFNLDEEVEFTLETPFGKLRFKALIVRMTKEKHGAYLNYYGCIFTQSSKNLVKYIFSLQRNKLNNQRNKNT